MTCEVLNCWQQQELPVYFLSRLDMSKSKDKPVKVFTDFKDLKLLLNNNKDKTEPKDEDKNVKK